MKACIKCSCVKPLAMFSKNRDTRLNTCKACSSDINKAWLAANHDKRLAYYREHNRRPERRERDLAYKRGAGKAGQRASLARYHQRYPEREAARNSLSTAVARGKVIPWPVCAVPECTHKPQAHHPDYAAPLSVVWLCRIHHKQAHLASEQ